MRGLMVIDVCSSNPACTPDLFALESVYPDVSVIENDCMSYCDACAEMPYVLVEQDFVTANDVPALMALLKARMDSVPPEQPTCET